MKMQEESIQERNAKSLTFIVNDKLKKADGGRYMNLLSKLNNIDQDCLKFIFESGLKNLGMGERYV
jgi:hypothetical protein